jgi:hypothetical protein
MFKTVDRWIANSMANRRQSDPVTFPYEPTVLSQELKRRLRTDAQMTFIKQIYDAQHESVVVSLEQSHKD